MSGGYPLRQNKYLRFAYSHARVLICECSLENYREAGRTEFLPGVQLSPPIYIKPKAAKSWWHGWPLKDQTCHFSYRSVREEAQMHTLTCTLPFSPPQHIPACLCGSPCLLWSKSSLSNFAEAHFPKGCKSSFFIAFLSPATQRWKMDNCANSLSVNVLC